MSNIKIKTIFVETTNNKRRLCAGEVWFPKNKPTPALREIDESVVSMFLKPVPLVEVEELRKQTGYVNRQTLFQGIYSRYKKRVSRIRGTNTFAIQ